METYLARALPCICLSKIAQNSVHNHNITNVCSDSMKKKDLIRFVLISNHIFGIDFISVGESVKRMMIEHVYESQSFYR